MIKLGPVFGPPPLKLAKAGSVAAFVTVGVGITPAIAMLKTAMKHHSRVAVFHGDQSPRTMAFKAHLEAVVPKASGGILNLFFSRAEQNEMDSSPYYSEGRLTGTKIVDVLATEDVDFKENVDFFVCAGNTSTPLVKNELLRAGVNPDRIHLEFFGPFITSVEE